MTEFRIEYTIQRMDEGDEDFVDIGFGSSGGWSTINAASYAVESDIQNRSWETEPHMPDPEDAEGVTTLTNRVIRHDRRKRNAPRELHGRVPGAAHPRQQGRSRD